MLPFISMSSKSDQQGNMETCDSDSAAIEQLISDTLLLEAARDGKSSSISCVEESYDSFITNFSIMPIQVELEDLSHDTKSCEMNDSIMVNFSQDESSSHVSDLRSSEGIAEYAAECIAFDIPTHVSINNTDNTVEHAVLLTASSDAVCSSSVAKPDEVSFVVGNFVNVNSQPSTSLKTYKGCHCFVCLKNFNNADSLYKHYKQLPSHLLCPTCGKDFNINSMNLTIKIYLLHQHFTQCKILKKSPACNNQTGDPRQCVVCLRVFPTFEELCNHCKQVKRHLICPSCSNNYNKISFNITTKVKRLQQHYKKCRLLVDEEQQQPTSEKSSDAIEQAVCIEPVTESPQLVTSMFIEEFNNSHMKEFTNTNNWVELLMDQDKQIFTKEEEKILIGYLQHKRYYARKLHDKEVRRLLWLYAKQLDRKVEFIKCPWQNCAPKHWAQDFYLRNPEMEKPDESSCKFSSISDKIFDDFFINITKTPNGIKPQVEQNFITINTGFDLLTDHPMPDNMSAREFLVPIVDSNGIEAESIENDTSHAKGDPQILNDSTPDIENTLSSQDPLTFLSTRDADAQENQCFSCGMGFECFEQLYNHCKDAPSHLICPGCGKNFNANSFSMVTKVSRWQKHYNQCRYVEVMH